MDTGTDMVTDTTDMVTTMVMETSTGMVMGMEIITGMDMVAIGMAVGTAMALVPAGC